MTPYSGPILDLNGRKGRYGLAYLRNICAQASYGLSETDPDEDQIAIDCRIVCYTGDIRVQVKCTTKDFTTADPHLLMPVDEEWKMKWASSTAFPTYFLVVRVPTQHEQWILQKKDETTLHNTAAYWSTINGSEIDSSIQVKKSQHFTRDTVKSWENEMLRLSGLYASLS